MDRVGMGDIWLGALDRVAMVALIGAEVLYILLVLRMLQGLVATFP